jgi:hypothetical protein
LRRSLFLAPGASSIGTLLVMCVVTSNVMPLLVVLVNDSGSSVINPSCDWMCKGCSFKLGCEESQVNLFKWAFVYSVLFWVKLLKCSRRRWVTRSSHQYSGTQYDTHTSPLLSRTLTLSRDSVLPMYSLLNCDYRDSVTTWLSRRHGHSDISAWESRRGAWIGGAAVPVYFVSQVNLYVCIISLQFSAWNTDVM